MKKKKFKEKIDKAIKKFKDEKEAAKESRKFQEKLEEKRKARQNSRKRGSGASSTSIKLKPKELETTHDVPWQILLDDLVGGKGYYDYTQPKQVRYGIVDDSWRILPTINVEIAIDVSGSVSEDLVRNFLSECKGIFSATNSKLEMKIGFFDTTFMAPLDDGTYAEKISAETKDIDNASDIDKLEIPGGGGTDFEVALSGFSDMSTNKIVFTDGYAGYENLPEMDVIWIVYGVDPPKIDPPGAKGVIYVRGKQFDELNSPHLITTNKTKGLRR